MNDRLKKALDQVQAEDELKQKTKEYVFQKANGCKRTKKVHFKLFLPAAACTLLIFLGGYWLYFVPTAEISMDINPSIELDVNRFDRVISVEGWNDDGKELARSLDIWNLEYSEAVNRILENETVADLLSDDGILTIAVVGENEDQTAQILSGVQSCTAGEKNAYCYSAAPEEVEEAHKLGLSYGKYRAFLELQELDPSITAEEIQNMSMREIRNMIQSLTDSDGSAADHTETGSGYGIRGSARNYTAPPPAAPMLCPAESSRDSLPGEDMPSHGHTLLSESPRRRTDLSSGYLRGGHRTRLP